MGYNIAFSALTATAEAIDVTSNNIANAQTVGYKAGEYVFADQFFRAQDPQSRDRAGMGTYREAIRRNQSFGTLTGTQNALDLAISGKGMFVLAKDASNNVPSQTPSVFQYTRNGQFALDAENRIVNENGMFLVGYPADVNGNVSNASFSVLKLDPTPLDAKQSTASTINLNLDNRGNPVAAVFDPTKSVTYSQSTAQTVYDASGNQHTLSVFYKKVDPAPLYFYPKVQGDNSSFQYNTKQNIYALGDTNGVLPTTFSDDINASAADLSVGASGSAALSLASTAEPAVAGNTSVSTLQDTKLKAFPAGQDKTYLLTLNDGTELTVTKEVSSTPGSTNVRYKYISDRYEVYATLDGVNVNTGNMDVTELSQLQKGWVSGQGVGTVNPPSITETQGVTSLNESAQVTFQNLVAGQSISLGGLTFTATQAMTATDVASAFSSLADGAKSSDLNGLNKSNFGTYSGVLSGWDTGTVVGLVNDTIVFNSTTPATNVDNLTAIVPGTAPTIIKTEGVTGTYETASATFTVGLTNNQSVTLGGLTFKANQTITAADVASAFTGINDGDTALSLNSTKNIAYGTFIGALDGWNIAAGTGATNIELTATGVHANVDNLVASPQTNLPGLSNQTNGVTGVAAQYSVPFPVGGMKSGEAITIGGLTFTASRDITQLEAQAAFSGLVSGSSGNASPIALNGVSYSPTGYGAYSGTLGSWTTDTSTTAGLVTFSSALGSAPFHGVNSLVLTQTARSVSTTTAPSVSNANNGVDAAPGPAAAAYEDLTFSAMKGGDSVTVDGLTFTATRDLTSTEAAAAFASLAAGTTAASLNLAAATPTTYGVYSATAPATGLSANWKTGSNSGGSTLRITAQVLGQLGALHDNSGVAALPTPTRTLRSTALSSVISATTVHAGVNDVTESADVTFSSLTVGQSITLGGLTFTATSAVSAANVAAAFASLTDGQTGAQLNAMPQSTYGTFSGALSGWNTTLDLVTNNVVHFLSSTPAADVAGLTIGAPGQGPNIVTTNGAADVNESNDVVFHQLSANQSVTIGGLTFVSTGTTSAADVAMAFSGLQDGDVAETLNARGQSTFGKFSGTLSGWNTTAGLSGHVTFESATPGFNVVDLNSTIATTAPTISVIDGVHGVTESARVVFDTAPMAAGDSITLAGLTFTAGSQGATAQQVANAFANLRNGDTQGLGLVNGSYSGTFTGWATGGVSNANQLTFASTRPNINVTDLVASVNRRPKANTRITDIAVSGAAAGTYKFTQGASQSGTTETAKVSFTSLAAGKTVTLGGLTYKAGPNGATATQVANAFAGLENGATIGLGTTLANGGGSYSGQLTNWSTSEVVNNAVVFTSSNPSANVSDLYAAQSGVSPAIVETQGVHGSDETASVTFNPSGLVAGQTMSLGGLTFTATTTVTATQLAAAFASLNDGDTSAALNIVPARTTYGTFSGELSGWKTGANTGANLGFTSTSAATNVNDLASNALTTQITINKIEGVTGSTETAEVDFTPSSLVSGQTVSLGGLTFTAGATGASAADVASAFSGLNDGDTGADLNASIKSTKGTFTGTFTGYFTVAGSTTSKVVFTATQQNRNISDLNLNLAVQTTAPNVTTTPGVTGVAAQYSVPFPVGGMKSGEAITIGGLTFTASRDITQLEAQAAFSGLVSGSSGNASPIALNGVSYSPTGYGAYSGTLGSWTTDTSTTAGLVTFSSALGSAPFHGVNNLTLSQTARGAGTVTTPSTSAVNNGTEAVAGPPAVAATAAHEDLTFSAMKGGDSVTVDGLTFTATRDLTSTEAAAAFASLTHGVTGASLNTAAGAPTLYGSYSGTLSANWNTGSNGGTATLTITAQTAGAIGTSGPAALPVRNSATRSTALSSVIATNTLHAGVNDVTESADVTFSALTVGQSITLGGLTFKPSSNATADDVAAAFAGLADGANPTSLTAATEFSTITFGALAAGASLTVAGLRLTNGTAGTISAANVADAFATNGATLHGLTLTSGSLAGWTASGVSGTSDVTFTSTTANSNVTDISVIQNAGVASHTLVTSQGQAPGSYTGALSGWVTTAGAAGHVTFASSTPAMNVANLVASVPGPQPTFTITQGVADVTESNDVVFHRLTKGQAISIGGLTFLSNGVTSAADVALAFSGITDGTTAATLNAMPNAFGTFSGVMTGWNTTAGVANHVTFTSSNPFTNVTDLAATVPGPAPTILTTQGVANVTESANVTFDSTGLLKGQTITLAGLTFTASQDITDLELAKAFSGLSDGDITGEGYAYGDYSGTFSGWNTGTYNNSPLVVFSSSNPASNVADLTPTLAGNPPTITKVDGIPNSNQVTLTANGKSQTVTLDSTTTVLDFDKLGIKINLATNGDTTSTIARIFDGKTITIGDGNPIGTMAFVGGKNIDSLARDNFGKPDFNSKMTISTTVGAGAALNKIAMSIDSTNMTAFSSAAQTYDSTTNGNPFSQLTAFAFDNYGKLTASYDNGQTVVKGQLVIADFNNTEGLIPVGGNAYEMSGVTGMQSGAAIYSVANTGSLGAIHSKTIENSNVDVTYELVKLMTLQRQYSAASQAVKTQAATLIDDAIRIGQ